jgi:YD repeat-containing protein
MKLSSSLGCLTATLAVCIVVNLTHVPTAHAQLIGCEQTGTGSCVADSPGPAPGEQFTELSSGIFTYSKTDMTLPGPMPINVTRVYRSGDKVGSNWNARAFGLGTSLGYDMFLYSFSEAANGQFTDAEVVMPDGGMIKCIRSDTNAATDYVDAVFACNQQPTGVWFGSTLTYNSGWDLKRLDGTTYHFGFNSPLQTITDRYGNYISIVRGGPKASICSNAVPANSISTISSSNNRSVSFCYDDSNYAAGISKITDNSAVGKLVTYTYGPNQQLQTATQTALNAQATTTYHYNQTSPSGQGNITEIIVNDACSGTNCGSPLQFFTYVTYVTNALGHAAVKSVSSQLPGNGYQYSYTIPNGWTSAQQVTVTLPDNSKRTFIYDSAGYALKDQRNVGVSGTNAEYTVFTRGQQTIGTTGNATGSTEFVGQVKEQDQNQSTVRQTTYNYDNNGNVLSTTISPKPGAADNVNTDCCSTSAIWNYNYTTFNRLASAIEPLAFSGTGTSYTYDDTPSAPKMTVTDPISRATIVTYNPQGQPISVRDPLGHTSSTTYFSSGDVQTSTDAAGKTTTYQPDADGRVIKVTSPLNEVTTYAYDALDEVTDVYVDPAGLNLHTKYAYDLVGEIASVTTPNGNKTTYTRTASLSKTTVTDPLGKTTVTNLNGQGGATDYTDKRGIKTTYTYDQFGRILMASYNSNGVSGFPTLNVQVGISEVNGAYDALDRPENIFVFDGLTYRGPGFTYDSLDSVLAETDWDSHSNITYRQLQYQYDSNGRRIQLQPTLNGSAEPTINYGYDCADELVSMSNNGSALQSCSPGTSVTNGSTSTQVGFNYDSDGSPAWTLVDGVQTVFGRDSDERVTSETFQPYPSGASYGNLTYGYDDDGRVIDKGGSFANITLPPSDSATYSAADQLLTFNGSPSNPDKASNITSDPVIGRGYTWNARNQLSAISGGVAETYDALGRRETSSSGTDSLSLIHDGSWVIGLSDSPSGNTWTLLPGALAGSFTSGGTTTTWVPLIDISGSTIALVNAAQTGSPPATIFTYDPSGVASVGGLTNSFPFLYQGLEHEVTDPAQLYFEPSGNVYNPQIQRDLSPVGQQGIDGAPSDAGAGLSAAGGGGPGNGGFENFGGHGGSGGGGPSNLSTALSDLSTVFTAAAGATLGVGEFKFWVPFALIGDLFGLLDSGGSDREKPYQLNYGRHSIYPYIGIAEGLTPTQKKAKCDCPTAPVLPRSTVDDNIKSTQEHGAGIIGRTWWKNKVRPYGDWAYNYDHPGAWRKWDYAGNFNFGATGRACGYSDSDLVVAGAELQQWNGTYNNGLNSKAWEIRMGERYYDCGCYKH